MSYIENVNRIIELCRDRAEWYSLAVYTEAIPVKEKLYSCQTEDFSNPLQLKILVEKRVVIHRLIGRQLVLLNYNTGIYIMIIKIAKLAKTYLNRNQFI